MFIIILSVTLGKSNPVRVLTAKPSKHGTLPRAEGALPRRLKDGSPLGAAQTRSSPERQRVHIFMCTHAAGACCELPRVKGTATHDTPLKFSRLRRCDLWRIALDPCHAHSPLPPTASRQSVSQLAFGAVRGSLGGGKPPRTRHSTHW